MINGDAIPGAVSAHGSPGRVGILPGSGEGAFEAPAFIELGTRVASVVIGDLDRDDAAEFSFGARVYLGNGDGSFQAPMPAGSGQYVIAVGDLNGDGDLDVVGANLSDNAIYVSLGRGDGSFENSVDFEITNRPFEASFSRIVISDVPLDSAPEILFVEEPGRELVSVLIGDGTGFFSGQSGYILTAPLQRRLQRRRVARYRHFR